MKINNSYKKQKNVIVGENVSSEGIYYASLFGAALITSIVLLIISTKKFYRGLEIYASILIPVFAIACIAAVRYLMVSKNTVYLTDEHLVIKSFFITKSFKISDIKKISATHNSKGKTPVVITSGEATHVYKLNLTKEQASKIKRSIYEK